MLHLLKRLPRKIAVLRMATSLLTPLLQPTNLFLSLSFALSSFPYFPTFFFILLSPSRIFLPLLLLLFLLFLLFLCHSFSVPPSFESCRTICLFPSLFHIIIIMSAPASCSRHSNYAVVYIQFVSRNYNLSRIGAREAKEEEKGSARMGK